MGFSSADAFGGANSESRRLWGVVVGVLGAQVMDFCLDQTETPLRAFTLDVCIPRDQHRAFALQTVFIGKNFVYVCAISFQNQFLHFSKCHSKGYI